MEAGESFQQAPHALKVDADFALEEQNCVLLAGTELNGQDLAVKGFDGVFHYVF